MMINMQNAEYKKIFIVVLVLIILTIGLFILRRERKKTLEEALKKETASTGEELQAPTITPEVLSGVYKIIFEKGNISVGESVGTSASFTTDSRILSGSDVILSFDPAYLEVEGDIKPGDYFSSYPRKLVDNAKGIVKATAFGGSGQIVSQPTTLFTVTFKAKKEGTTTLSFDFAKGRTNLTTLVEKGTSKNILGNVYGATLTIGP